jgi:ribosomal protein S18 acetylase RimI-like enzyme
MARLEDFKSWMEMIADVRDNFPGLDTEEQMISYQQTVLKNINRGTAICVKFQEEVVGVLIFSTNVKCLSCMAVHPEHRRKGVATEMITKMLEFFPRGTEVTVTTFLEEDPKGVAPRALYKKFGFVEGEYVTEFNYQHQKLRKVIA